MKKSFLTLASISLLVFGACQNIKEQKNDPSVLSAKAIAIHDEIMPQISIFDKHTVLIDSLLGDLTTVQQQAPSIDTTAVRNDLTELQSNLESATDQMMTWMKDYAPDSAETKYQQAQVDTITKLKNTFDKVSQDADRLLSSFNKKN